MIKNLTGEQIKYWYRKYIPENIRIFLSKLVPFWFQLRYFYFQTKKFDFEVQGHGEAKKLLEICSQLNISNGYYVDVGASDGWTSSSTFPLARNPKFSGLSIELDDKKFKKMQYIYKDFQNAYLCKSKVTPLNVLDLLNEFDVPQNFDVLNLDVDSYDLFIIKEILKSFQPKIVSMEINEKVPVPIYFTVNYDENHFWKGDDFFGCSLQAAHEELIKFDYKLYTVIYNNAIFIPSNMNINFPNFTLSEFYERGYVNKIDRKEKFPYNNKYDILLEMNQKDSINFINNIFKEYRGKFQLESRNY